MAHDEDVVRWKVMMCLMLCLIAALEKYNNETLLLSLLFYQITWQRGADKSLIINKYAAAAR